jgi:hypothetical protein
VVAVFEVGETVYRPAIGVFNFPALQGWWKYFNLWATLFIRG